MTDHEMSGNFDDLMEGFDEAIKSSPELQKKFDRIARQYEENPPKPMTEEQIRKLAECLASYRD